MARVEDVATGTTELGDHATEGVTRSDPADKTRLYKRAADVGDRRSGQSQASGELAETRGDPAVLSQQGEDRRGPGDGRGERARVEVRARIPDPRAQ